MQIFPKPNIHDDRRKDFGEQKFFDSSADWFIYVIICVVTIGIYWQVNSHEFINYDDDIYITDNENIKNGFSFKTVLWAFTDTSSGNIHPLTWFSHILDYTLFGADAGNHHLVNVVFHVANSILIFIVFRRMTGTLWRSAFLSAMFALHPLHVESVTWASERKDVLSTLFFLLTIWAYIQYVQNRQRKTYLLSIFLYILGLMSKPMLVTLPFVLLLLDYWPLRRFDFVHPSGFSELGSGRSRFPWSLVYEKTPFFILTVFWSFLTFVAQQAQGAVKTLDAFPLHVRLANAVVGYIRYLEKTALPNHLAVLYPHQGMPSFTAILCSSVLLIVLFSAAWIWRNNRPWFVAGWLWYVGTLVPVIGIIQIGHHSIADRYAYIPMIGVSIMIAWGATEFVNKRHISHKVLWMAGFSVLLYFSVFTYRQIGYWSDSITLLTHTVEITENNYRSHYNLGNALSEKGRTDEAIDHYKEAIRINPEYAPSYNNLANALANQGQYEDAIPYFHEAIRIDPESVEAYRNLGLVLSFQGKTDEAIQYMREAVRIKPNDAVAHNDLGYLLLKKGREKEALEHFLEEINLRPDTGFQTFYTIARIYGKNGNIEKAISWLSLAVEKGFDRWEFLRKDRFMESVKDSSYYKTLMEHHRG